MTSLNDLVMLVMLVLCIGLTIPVTYLVSKVNELESTTSNLLQSSQAHDRPTNDIFGGLRGKQLWDAWQVAVSTSVDEFGLDRDRDRLMMLLELHVRELVRAGKAIGLTPSAEPSPGDTVTLRTLRGDFESYLPPSLTESFFACGKKISSASSDEERAQVITELDIIPHVIGMVLLVSNSLNLV